VRWVSRSLKVKHKIKRKTTSSKLLACSEAEGEAFLSQIVTADETWVHDFESETKKGNPWNGTILNIARRKNSKSLCERARS
jgi:hypothetical protein